MKNTLKMMGLLLLSPAVYANDPPHHPFEATVLFGGSYIPNTIEGETLELIPYGIGPYADTFTDQSDAGAVTWGLDAKYRFKLHSPSVTNYIFDSIGLGADVFQIMPFKQTGHVLQFGMPQFENYKYTLRTETTRFMIDADLDFHPIARRYIPFIEAGLGAAVTTVSYSSKPISPVQGPEFELDEKTSWTFAYQVGAGLKYVINPRVIVSLHYLYANMGNVDSSTTGNSASLGKPLTLDMSTQNLVIGLTYAQ